jgi:UrcA family protein
MSRMLILAAVAAALSGPAMAYQLKSTADGGTVVTLSTARVDFNNQAQVKAFYTQIKRTADDFCRIPSLSSTIARPDADCVAAAVAHAVRMANRPLLTAAYAGEAGGRDVAVHQAGNNQ